MRSPGANERVRWAASMLGRRGIDLASAASRRAARDFVNDIGKRMLSESADYSRVLESPNAAADPLAWMRVTEAGFRELALRCAAIGPPVAAVLEGGYNLETLPSLVAAAQEGFSVRSAGG